jgi:hypothetical protein
MAHIKTNKGGYKMAELLTRAMNGGIQVVHKFDNGLGASVVKAPNVGFWGSSYGYDQGLWELAVLTFTSEDEYVLNYSTPITNDVLGHLSDEDVIAVLARIEALEV